MKVYYLNYRTIECGEIEAFASRKAAEKRLREMNKEQAEAEKNEERAYEIIPDEVSVTEFPISAQGVVDAFAEGAFLVMK